ncbi:uncharacterized protein LOC120940360 isoform X2 [Rana temporaria]|uniref:uncharacterized protein LOC120924461 isoform X2 n=1 Tax=Rana temporaria TaxID=8407 RepID=UPI001AACA814|nr:uncharacterized protein LOC120924461 isoform X2 [Rana temporaria]XP_040209093.1 uncharacterized protein LOC120940360 isoform X2 [Rana temporaria]
MTQEVLGIEERGEDSMAARDISHEAIIALVHARPELWDPECPGYADRVLKRSKWEEVYKFVTPNWDEMSATDQDNRGKEVYTRWRSLRDRYKKEVNEEKSAERSGAPSTRRRANPHAEALSFLRRTTEMRAVPARAIARRASSSPENNTETSQETIPETVSSQDYQEPPEPQGNLDKRARSSSTTRRPRQQETPFEDYFNRIIVEMRKQSQNDAKKDEFLNISDPDVIFLRMLLCVLREIPPEKRTDVRGDIHAYLTYIVSACKEQRPYPKFQPWALGFNSPSGSLSQPMPSPECRDTTPVMNSYAGPPPTYTPFPSYPGFQRMHGQPHPVSSPSSTQSVQHIDVGSEPSPSTLRSSYPVYQNL